MTQSYEMNYRILREASLFRIGAAVPRKYELLSKVNQSRVYLWLQIKYNSGGRNNVTTDRYIIILRNHQDLEALYCLLKLHLNYSHTIFEEYHSRVWRWIYSLARDVRDIDENVICIVQLKIKCEVFKYLQNGFGLLQFV